MHELLMVHESARSERDGWMEDNTRGLSLAALAEWDEAAEAFAAAADVLARCAPDPSSHDALALILGNLAQACFRAGRTDDALPHAQRACALRVALTGEDAMPVARARMDLAVMLGASGRLDEAQDLIQRAIAAVELHAGDEDARLVVMLENAARLALAAGAPADAEPLLLRLHALLDLYGMSTDCADRLLAMVAGVRSRAEATRATASRAAVAVNAHASIDEHEAPEDWDDQPLRDAVAITGELLRTTTSGVSAIPEPVNHDARIFAAFETVVNTPAAPMIDLVDEMPTETVDIALDLADSMVDVPTHRPSLEREPAPLSPPMPTERDVTRAQAGPHAADADQASAQAAVRSARTGRTPMSDRHRTKERGSRVVLIVVGVGAAVAAGGAAWYFLLR